MKKCNTELMKELKAVQYELRELEDYGVCKSKVTYYEGEGEVDRSFDYVSFTNTYNELLAKEAHIKALLAKSNAETKLIGMEDMTIGEGLIKLAQLNIKLKVIAQLKSKTQITKNVKHATFDGDKDRTVVDECLYDVKKVDADIKDLQREISRLQVAIDRTNLINTIEY